MRTAHAVERGMARREFIACTEEVMALRDQGYTNLQIHAELVERRGLTMAYRTFCKHLQRHLAACQPQTTPSPPSLARSAQPQAGQRSSFTHNPSPRKEDFL